ncbi:aldo/keto reductase [Halobacteriales archaeon Cl-PHB]
MDQVTAGGVSVPAIGLGTYPLTGEPCREVVETALAVGYRHVDTAQLYDNEAAVGAAIRKSSVPREEVVLTTKVRRENLAYDDVVASVEASLDRLGTHVDLLLVHAPSPTVPISESIEALNALQERGDVGAIGVSNFTVDQLETARTVSETPIVTNQVAYHPYEDRSDLLAYCLDHDVALTAYSPLARGQVLDDPTLESIGERYDKTPAHVALRWLVQQDPVVAIPKASSRQHLAANLAVFDFRLTDDEMARIFELRGSLTDRVRSLLGL